MNNRKFTSVLRDFQGNFIQIMCIGTIIFLIGVICTGAYYTILHADDFSHACNYSEIIDLIGISNTFLGSNVVISLVYAMGVWLNWQGTYSAMFIQALFSPLNGNGMIQLRIVMIINALLLLISLVVILYVLLGRLFKKNNAIFLCICTGILYLFTSSKAYTEIFYWYSGATSYSFPMSCLFLSLILLVLSTENKSKVYYIFSAVLGVCAMGGSLCIAGTGCYFLLIILLGYYLENKTISKRYIGLFCIYFLGALLNAIAIGNFSRHASYGKELKIIGAMKNTLELYLDEIRWVFFESPILVVGLIFLLFGVMLSKQTKVDPKNYLLCSICFMVIPIVAIYPVVLAYNGVSYFPNRCQFVADLFLEISVLNLFLSIGCICETYCKKSLIRNVLFVIVSVIVVFIYSSQQKNYPKIISEQTEAIRNGSLAGYYQECIELYDYLGNSDEKHIILENYPEKIEVFGGLFISEDQNDWINQSIATWYNKDSIVVVP